MVFAALVANALYPAALLVQHDAALNRRAVAVFDAVLDTVFAQVFFYAMIKNFCIAAAFPTDLMPSLSLFYPTAHVVFVCRAIEVAAADLAARKRRAGDGKDARKASMRTAMALTGRVDNALSLWKGARFAIVALGVVAAALFVKCADRYPLLDDIPGPCAPCVCSDAGVLKGCPYHAELNDPVLWISGRRVTAVEKTALKGNEGAGVIFLHDNNLETLPAGVFDNLQNPFFMMLEHNRLTELPAGLFDKIGPLHSLYLDHNQLSVLPPGLFDSLAELRSLGLRNNRLRSLPSETFCGLTELTSVDLSSNNISHFIRAGTFANPDLRFVSLANNAVPYVEAGAFGKSLEHVWLTGNNLTCTGLVGVDGALPRGAGCTDGGICGAIYGVASIGNGRCTANSDPLYSTVECLWDGGDCD